MIPTSLAKDAQRKYHLAPPQTSVKGVPGGDGRQTEVIRERRSSGTLNCRGRDEPSLIAPRTDIQRTGVGGEVEHLALVPHDVGEAQAAEAIPAKSHDVVDIAKLDLTQLHSDPQMKRRK
jgi:hypothetical protein